jgi:lipoprotein
MRNIKMKKLVLIALTGLLFGCSSEHDDLKTFMKCGIAANQLEQGAALKMISQKMEQYTKEKNIQGSARDALYLGQEVRDEMNLEGQSFEGQIETLIDIYNSSKCVKLHEQPEIDVSSLLNH